MTKKDQGSEGTDEGSFSKEDEKLALKKRRKICHQQVVFSDQAPHIQQYIVISKFGIFVIETKNYYGLIIGDKYKAKWIQYIGKNKYYFNNPIHQNYGHIKRLLQKY